MNIKAVEAILTARLADQAARLADAWDEGWWNARTVRDPTLLGYADNPYRAALHPDPSETKPGT